MNLIANTGIQLFTFPIEINQNDRFQMYFHEWHDKETQKLNLEIAHKFTDEDVWVRKYDLWELGYIQGGDVAAKWEDIKEDFLDENKVPIISDMDDPADSGCFQVTLNRLKWEKFENIWLPMPFFMYDSKSNRSQFGPTNWCRFKLIPIKDDGNIRKYTLLLAFDTKSIFEDESFEDDDLNETPVFTSKFDQSKEYALCTDEFNLIAFCSEAYRCDWVDTYILKQYHGINDINEFKGGATKLNYLAEYIHLLRYIQKLNILPSITLYSNQNVAYSNVDLVIDIGNSRTCAVLFDEGDFTKMSPLTLQDFSFPVKNGSLNKHVESFDMRLAFREAQLGGKMGIENSLQFIFPSFIRLGEEANALIHNAINLNTGAEKTSTFSSAKRFLWDSRPQSQEWEFVQLRDEKTKSVYIEGISEQINMDGSLNASGKGGMMTYYSRRALMTFSFLEILAQANMQINSYAQRSHWGNESKPRKIGRIIVTCPTAMSRLEQVSLRKCAEDARIILERFYNNTFNQEIDLKEARKIVEVIPSAKKLSNKEERTEWIYDEATAAQFVFLFAEIHERYLNNVEEYFEIYGKVRSDLGDYSKKSLTIGSLDIGAGTTDIMIAAHKYEANGHCTITPVPLFWESFYLAGDDLLKILVQRLVIEGQYSPIQRKLEDMGKDPIEFLQPFFGTDVGASFRHRKLRHDFNLLVSVPIVTHYLDLLKNDREKSVILTFNEIFKSNLPSQAVLNHFESHFGFRLESLTWTYERNVVASIIEQVFDSLVGKISSLFTFYHCDVVLLSGRPTSLKPLTDLFLKHFAISPNRLKSMNNYRVGKWYPEDLRYPFTDGNGRFTNPKSIITTGAVIGFQAENGGIKGFSLDLKDLKKKLLPTTNYFGKLNEQLKFTDVLISPDQNHVTFDVISLPFRIGVRQLNIDSYPSRPFYIFDFDDVRIEDRVKGRLDENADQTTIQSAIGELKNKIKSKMPLKVTVSRDIHEDIEHLTIENIENKDGDPENINFFLLQVQSLSEVDDFWLDSGLFSLNVTN